MIRTSFVIAVLFLLIGASFSGLGFQKKNLFDGYQFTPLDITLSDDAFHGGPSLAFTEWWYFDAMLSNGYSTQMSIRILSTLDIGVVITRLDFYKDGVLLTHNIETYQLTDLIASSDIPYVQLNGKTFITGSQDELTSNYQFTVSFDFPGNSASLQFIGCTKGWKGQHQTGDWWAVVLPRANVIGSITVQNTTMNVTGTGYHDHNWDVNGKTCLNVGWFWGKINSENYTATWSTILKTRLFSQPLLVINENNAGYRNIPSEDIRFSGQNLHLDHGFIIPHFFDLDTTTKKMFMRVNMHVISVHYERFMGIINYWRYHVYCTGVIIVDGHQESVNGVFIAEYLRLH
jgi:hypothetical protein